MSEQNIEQRIARLTHEIIRHNELYYRRAEPEISDLEYDRLKEDLASLESRHPNLIRPDSPARSVGDDRLEGFQSYRHRRPMLSLDNTYSRDELNEFAGANRPQPVTPALQTAQRQAFAPAEFPRVHAG